MKKNNLLSWVGIFLLMTTLMAMSCHKDKKIIEEKYPSITSITVNSITMTGATVVVNAINYTSISASIDGGGVVSVSGTSILVSGLTANKTYTVSVSATGAGGNASSSKSFTTSKSTLAISEFKITDTATNAAGFSFVANSDATIISQTLVNTNTNEVIDVAGKASHAVSNLIPNTSYSFTYKVKDNTGNEASQSITFKTKEKVSDWLSIVEMSYGEQFAIIGNAVSSKLTIKINNASSDQKSLTTLIARFTGAGSPAIKMLRYSLNGGSWVKSTAVVVSHNDDFYSSIQMQNVILQSGINTFECYFSLKPNVGGVANGSALSFTITSINDGEGGTIPVGGSFPATVSVGTVDAITQPTVITTNINAGMYINPTDRGPSSGWSQTGLYQVTGMRATGPAGARLTNVRLKNLYAAFKPVSGGGIEFDNSSWVVSTLNGPYHLVDKFIWQNDFVSLTLSNENNSNIVNTNGSSYNYYYVKCDIRNTSSSWFYSNDYTPGLTGLVLNSKYDFVILNVNGQLVDLSDVVVLQDGVQVTN